MKFHHLFPLILCLPLASCANLDSQDEPPFTTCPDGNPDFEQIILSASSHFNNWVVASDNVDFAASVKVTSPVDVKITGYTLMCDSTEVDTYPEPTFAVAAANFGHGAHSVSLYTNLEVDTFKIQKPVFENQNLVVFNERPTIKLNATVTGHITATSSTGETYEREFTATSNADGRIQLPAELFAWTPTKGTASTLSVELTFEPEVTKISDGLTAELSDLQWNLTDNTAVDGPTAKMTWSNPPTQKEWYGLTPSCVVSYSGTYEGIELDHHFIDGFIILL